MSCLFSFNKRRVYNRIFYCTFSLYILVSYRVLTLRTLIYTHVYWYANIAKYDIFLYTIIIEKLEAIVEKTNHTVQQLYWRNLGGRLLFSSFSSYITLILICRSYSSFNRKPLSIIQWYCVTPWYVDIISHIRHVQKTPKCCLEFDQWFTIEIWILLNWILYVTFHFIMWSVSHVIIHPSTIRP